MIIHLLLLWLLINKLIAGVRDESGAGGAGRGLTVVDLTGSASAPSAESTQERVQPPSKPAAVPTEMDSTIPTELKTEWSVTRIAVADQPAARTTPPSEAPHQTLGAMASGSGQAAAGAQIGSGGIGAGGGGGDFPYDPYAGAAPMRRSITSEITPQLDSALLQSIVDEIARRFPGRGGSAQLVVIVSAEGTVLNVDVAAGSASAPVKEALRRELLGKPLFRITRGSARERTVRLPILRV